MKNMEIFDVSKIKAADVEVDIDPGFWEGGWKVDVWGI